MFKGGAGDLGGRAVGHAGERHGENCGSVSALGKEGRRKMTGGDRLSVGARGRAQCGAGRWDRGSSVGGARAAAEGGADMRARCGSGTEERKLATRVACGWSGPSGGGRLRGDAPVAWRGAGRGKRTLGPSTGLDHAWRGSGLRGACWARGCGPRWGRAGCGEERVGTGWAASWFWAAMGWVFSYVFFLFQTKQT